MNQSEPYKLPSHMCLFLVTTNYRAFQGLQSAKIRGNHQKHVE